ncbi:MAG: C-type lectin domain-containing protein, partial [Treponema sp.]|nr:C-type lectin domain-containing protein [Treponema sp.]
WTDARRYCEERGGYLATITDSGEQTFIENLLAREGNKRFYWLGGYIGSDRRFQWLTGERFEYTNWMPGEPSGGGEDKLEILRVAHPLIKDSRLGHWNDAFNESNKNSDYTSELGIICEFDT